LDRITVKVNQATGNRQQATGNRQQATGNNYTHLLTNRVNYLLANKNPTTIFSFLSIGKMSYNKTFSYIKQRSIL
jgi:hypothetical protein